MIQIGIQTAGFFNKAGVHEDGGVNKHNRLRTNTGKKAEQEGQTNWNHCADGRKFKNQDERFK